jgi:hypothetical protein
MSGKESGGREAKESVVGPDRLADLLANVDVIGERLIVGDVGEHERVAAILAPLDEDEILDGGARLGRCYRWLTRSERRELRSRCKAWVVFDPVEDELAF